MKTDVRIMEHDNNGMPVVSVIMPAYGQAEYVAEALDSVLGQSYQDWEVIVVDDGSPDNVAEIVEEYAKRDKRIRFYHTENRGVSAARNFAVDKSCGEYLLPLDADDTIEPEYMERCIRQFVENPKTDVVYCQWRFFGSETKTRDMNAYRDYRSELVENSIFVSAVFRKSRFLEIGGYDENMHKGFEDWEFWIRFLDENSTVYMIPQRLLNYRQKEVSRNVEAARGMNTFDIELYLLSKHREKYNRYYGPPVRCLRYKNKYYDLWYKRIWHRIKGKKS